MPSIRDMAHTLTGGMTSMSEDARWRLAELLVLCHEIKPITPACNTNTVASQEVST